MRLKPFVLGIGFAIAVAGLVYCGKWSYDRLTVSAQVYEFLTTAPVDAQGKPLGKANRAAMLELLYADKINNASPIDPQLLKSMIQDEVKTDLDKLDKQAKEAKKK